MKVLHLLAVGAAMPALLVLAAGEASAVQGSAVPITPIVSGGQFPGRQITPIANGGELRSGRFGHHRGGHFRGGRHHGFRGIGGVFVVEREVPVYIEREVVVREVPAEPPPPPPPREPHVIGRSYASLPGGCLKLIEGGASYYHCSGEWYRQVGSGSAVKYRAVAPRSL